jgi:hypothetical protein
MYTSHICIQMHLYQCSLFPSMFSYLHNPMCIHNYHRCGDNLGTRCHLAFERVYVRIRRDLDCDIPLALMEEHIIGKRKHACRSQRIMVVRE